MTASKFSISKEYERTIKKYDVQQKTTEFKINPIPPDEEPVGWFKDAVAQMVTRTIKHLSPEHKVGITFCSKEFQNGPGYMRFQEASKLSIDDVWSIISGVFQSNSTGLNTDTFCLSVTSVKMPKGKGRGSKYNTYDEECKKRRGIIEIKNEDNMCLPRALVVAIAHATNDLKYKEIRQDIRKQQTVRAQQLIKDMCFNVPEEGCGIEELHLFQKHLNDFQIVVYQYKSKGRNVIFEGAPSLKKIYLLYHEGHFNVVTSLTAAFCSSYYCEVCHVAYNEKNKHRCGGTCSSCQQAPACPDENKVKCPDCGRTFRSAVCYDKHKALNSYKKNVTVCEELKICQSCLKTVKAEREHTCDEIFCKICMKHQPREHMCFMKVDAKKPKLESYLFVFYDFECRQETRLDNGDFLHEPNLCVLKTACEFCIDNTCKSCVKCGIRVLISTDYKKDNIYKRKPVEWLFHVVLSKRKMYKNVVVVAHNGQAYDHQFLLNHIITKTDLKPELIMRGTKIVQMLLENVKFIDSLNFFPMALAALPAAFDLGDKFKKGYFPHLFNTEANADYIGPLPDAKYYSPNTMKDDIAHQKFMAWYDEHKNAVFNFKTELVEYCTSDVEILAAACLKFRNLLLEAGGVCPLTESCTIASACNKVYRRNFLKPNTIGIIPKGGYRWKDAQSKIATQWLIWEEKQRNINIVHSAKQAEVVIGGLKVDGFKGDTNTVFEFHGCYYHGCSVCFKFSRDEPLYNNVSETFNMRFESTKSKTQRLKELGYSVVEMWECDFRRQLRNNSSITCYVENHPLLLSVPLNPRDAFYGGRTGNCVEYYKASHNEKIKYVDVCSLYPWVCKYGKFPVGHPEVIVGHGECSVVNLNETCGLIKCTIAPPLDLFHPVLPIKTNNKLMFSLCRVCAETLNKQDCNHSEGERALHGTWVIEEVVKAVEKGYQILNIHEIWRYQFSQYDTFSKTGGLFTEMMNRFIQYKQEASGWPADILSEENKSAYIEEFFNREGIKLRRDKIENNPGLRSLSKLMLNSFWGKLGQRENQTKTSIINKPCELFNLLVDPAIEVNGIQLVNEEVVVVNYEYIEEAYQPLSTVNVTLAAYTTAQARLKLYSYLELLGDRVLYYDTDSVIYISREEEYDVPIGNMLGDMTNELNNERFITKFASGGPKNYGYELDDGTTIAKVKGISLNYTTSKIVNFDKIATMIQKRGDSLPILTTNIRRTADHQVVEHHGTKTYRINSTKRRFTDISASVPYGYKRSKLV